MSSRTDEFKPIDRAEFGDHVRQMIEDSGRTMKGFARESGINYDTIWRWCHGVALPTLSSIERVARSLDIPVSECINSLLSRDNNKKSEEDIQQHRDPDDSI